jgi:nitroreductase
MDLYAVMRTTFAARQFTADPVSDELIERILEHARFAPSGGNRQAGHVIIVRQQSTKHALADLAGPAARRYVAQLQAGESAWNPVLPTKVTPEQIAAARVPAALSEPLRQAPVVLVVCVDLRLVAAIDQQLPRVGIVSGASVYPLAWNILLGARNEGLGGVLTTMPIAEEPRLRDLLGLPAYVAVAAIMPIGWPVRQLQRLTRHPVRAFAHRERWDGTPFGS